MKVLFLDIDGVLNNRAFLTKQWENKAEMKKSGRVFTKVELHSFDIDKEAVEILNFIIEKTQVQVVLSSSWKIFGIDYVQKCLVDRGFRYSLFDITPRANGKRGVEIRAWLQDKDVSNFIVLDDEMSDIKDFINAENLFKTSFNEAFLSWSLAEDIVSFLNIPVQP